MKSKKDYNLYKRELVMYDWKKRAKDLIETKFGKRKQAEFAAHIGFDPAYLNHKLSGIRKATEEDKRIIAEGLNITYYELVTDPDEYILISKKAPKITEKEAAYTVKLIAEKLATNNDIKTLQKMLEDIKEEIKRQNQKGKKND